MSAPTAPTPCPEGTQNSTEPAGQLHIKPGFPFPFPEVLGWDNVGVKLQSCSLDEAEPVSLHSIPIPAFHVPRSPCSLPGFAQSLSNGETFSAFNHCHVFFEQNMNFSPKNRVFLCNQPLFPAVLSFPLSVLPPCWECRSLCPWKVFGTWGGENGSSHKRFC